MMSFKHSLISPLTRTLFGPPRGISSTLPSLTYRATMLLAVDLFIPKASTKEVFMWVFESRNKSGGALNEFGFSSLFLRLLQYLLDKRLA